MSHINKGDIHAYLDGALGAYPEDVARHVREHLDACRECAQLLEVERRLRQEASAIIAASAQGPVELDPLEELLARAEAFDGQEQAEEPEGSGRRGWAGRSVGSRLYVLRWAATVVVSLGAGWMARDVAGPGGNAARGVVAEPFVTEGGLRPAADQQRAERNNAGGLAEEVIRPELQSAVAGDLVEAEAEAPGQSPGGVVAERGRLGADRGAGRFDDDVVSDDDAVLDQVEAVPEQRRAESAVAREVGPADVSVATPAEEPRAQVLSDELRASASAADGRAAASRLGNAAPAPSAVTSLSTTSFLVPGLPVRDVRWAPEADGLAGGQGGSVVVTQELADGRLVELQFVPRDGSEGLVGGVLNERNDFLGRRQPEGWATAVRNVPGGVAVLSGPLTEPELAALLDRALGG